MTRRTALPSVEDVRTAIAELGEATGRPPSVVALAHRLGLANTTFRRNFPDIAAEMTHIRSSPPADPATAVSQFEQLKRDNDKLRRDNHELTAHLDVAVANIQRLTVDNHQLRQHLDAATKVTRIDLRHQSGRAGNRPR